jgi:hypothetical protein
MSWTDMPGPPGAQPGVGGAAGVQPAEGAGAMSWTDMPGPPGAQPAEGAGAASGAQPSEGAGAMSWTDMPGPSGAQPGVGGAAGVQPAEGAGAMSWTDMPGPQVSGSPDTRVSEVAAEPPLLPSSYDENDLRAAVGAAPRPQADAGATAGAVTKVPARSRRRAPTDEEDGDGDDDDSDDGTGKPRSRKMMLFGALTLVVGGGIAAMVIVGKVNSERYLITCEADRVVVQQGRSFPPWGESSLDGPEWKALKIPPEAPCAPYETENKAELAAHYFKILQEHATSLLTAREVTKVDEAEAQLKQALLVARALPLEDDRIDARDEIERLLGDVVYWRASAKLQSASEALTEAAKQFDMAAQQRPRHVTDAAAWALYVRRLVEQLRAGPAGASQATFPPLPPGERPTAPPGVALPVEPGAGSGSDVADDPVPAPPADAGLPTGGVLL